MRCDSIPQPLEESGALSPLQNRTTTSHTKRLETTKLAERLASRTFFATMTLSKIFF
jgi:hypothetical protein